MKLTKYIFLSTLSIMLASCISTNVRDFTDPEYQTFTASKLLVVTPNQEFDDIFLKTLRNKNINISANRMGDVFLPTRKYDTEEMVKIVQRKGYDATIIITIAGDQSSSQVVSYMTNSSANAYSTGYGSAYATGSGTTVPITAHRRNTTSQAVLYDPVTQRKIWVADLSTKAKGSLYMQNDDTMESISEEVINALLRKHHLTIKTNKK